MFQLIIGRRLWRRLTTAALGSALEETHRANQFAHILFVKRKGSNVVTAETLASIGTKLGGFNQAEITAETPNLADLARLFLCSHTATTMLGVDGTTGSMANAKAITGPCCAPNGIAAIICMVVAEKSTGHTLSRHGRFSSKVVRLASSGRMIFG